MASLFGALLLSAIGSLPLHLLPLLVSSLVEDGRAPVADAGQVASAYMVGQLVTAVTLPLFRVATIPRTYVLALAAFVALSVGASASVPFIAILGCWLFAGAACGALIYWGTAYAAAQVDKKFAFSLRLAIVQFSAALVIVLVQSGWSDSSYFSISVAFLIVLFALSATGATLYRPVTVVTQVPIAQASPGSVNLTGILIVYFLFAGQIGFWAYALQRATDSEIGYDQARWAIALAKFATGFALLLAARNPRPGSSLYLLTPGLLLGIGIVAASMPASFLVFLCGVFAWEVGLNVLSARLQAKVTEAGGVETGYWLAAAILLGSATGPLLQGPAIEHGWTSLFLAFAIATGLLPVLWTWRQRVL